MTTIDAIRLTWTTLRPMHETQRHAVFRPRGMPCVQRREGLSIDEMARGDFAGCMGQRQGISASADSCSMGAHRAASSWMATPDWLGTSRGRNRNTEESMILSAAPAAQADIDGLHLRTRKRPCNSRRVAEGSAILAGEVL